MAGRKPIHGHDRKGKRTALYMAWHNMKSRCDNPNVRSHEAYGARGIRVCDEWLEFESFMTWAFASGYKEGLTIERKDVNGNYEPANCCWIPRADQGKNLRKNVRIRAFGQEKTKSEWAEDPRCVVSLATLHYRLKDGRDPEEAMTTPVWTNLKRSKGLVTKGSKKNVKICAFGEEKIVVQWMRDPRCVVSSRTFCPRLKNGMGPEEAMTTPVQAKFRNSKASTLRPEGIS